MRYWLTDDLLRESCSLASRIATQEPIAGIAGVPRSGMLAATAAALHLGVPLYEATFDGLRLMGSGRRIEGRNFPGRVIVMEDSLNRGLSFSALRTTLGSRHIYASVFATERGAKVANHVGIQIELPHWFDWWIWQSLALLRWKIGIDFDGILCEDCPPHLDDDGPAYAAWMRDVKPLRHAGPHGALAIITGRLQKYRTDTESWMARHRQSARQIIFGHWPTKAERRGIADFKATQVKSLGLRYFIESDHRQAAKIAQTAGIPVPCPAARTVFLP